MNTDSATAVQLFRIAIGDPTNWGLCPQTPEVFCDQRCEGGRQ